MKRRVYYSFDEDEGGDDFVFEVDELHYKQVIGNLTGRDIDLDMVLEKAVAMLSANVRLHDEDMDQDVVEAQMVATATVWFLFNEAADEEDRIDGDVLLIERGGELFVADVAVQPVEGDED